MVPDPKVHVFMMFNVARLYLAGNYYYLNGPYLDLPLL